MNELRFYKSATLFLSATILAVVFFAIIKHEADKQIVQAKIEGFEAGKNAQVDIVYEQVNAHLPLHIHGKAYQCQYIGRAPK